MILEKFSIGVGDRFARQGKAQLSAFVEARARGVEVVPVWNKSFREHSIIGSSHADVRREADAAVQALRWPAPYHVDADHISLKTVDAFLDAADFFTLDVADVIGHKADDAAVNAFVEKHRSLARRLDVPGIPQPLDITPDRVADIARHCLLAVREAAAIYRRIEQAKGKDRFITEVSMDETDRPQTPVELLFILAAIADAGIPAQTIAPKFTGRFNKGVDYVGDVARFAREFRDDLAVIAFAVREFDLPPHLKLSVHSGSDKFSIYPSIRDAIRETGAGLHLKTAGTTWLEELIGLALAGREGLRIAQDVYAGAFARFDELCGPYATVIDIDRARLPAPADLARWSGAQFAAALRHDPACPAFNPSLRQLLHVGYKVAAEMGPRYLDALDAYADIVGQNVAQNLLDRHLKPLFFPTP